MGRFRIRYPPGWRAEPVTFDRTAAQLESMDGTVTFAPPSATEEFLWRVDVLSSSYAWSASKAFPAIHGRTFARSAAVIVDGLEATRHVAVVCDGEPMRVDTVVLEHGSRTFLIVGGTDASFENFVESLEVHTEAPSSRRHP
jgi:hypothetical protein